MQFWRYFRKQLGGQLGMDLVVSDPAALQKFPLSEMARWAKVVKAHGIKADWPLRFTSSRC